MEHHFYWTFKRLILTYLYKNLVTFGGYQEDFMLVVNNMSTEEKHTEKLLFTFAKPKVSILTKIVYQL